MVEQRSETAGTEQIGASDIMARAYAQAIIARVIDIGYFLVRQISTRNMASM